MDSRSFTGNVDIAVDNCGLSMRLLGKTIDNLTTSLNTLWITVDELWTNKGYLSRENSNLSTFHRPITVIDLFIT